MKNIILPNGEQYIRKRRAQKRWHKVRMVLEAIVVFCTTYALILPAITAERGCDLPEHIHTDACYMKVVSSMQDTQPGIEEFCTFQEDDGVHNHKETCYDENGQLICEIEETSEHQYEIEELICGQTEHIHDGECTPEFAETQAFDCTDEGGRYELKLTVTDGFQEDVQLCVEMMDENAMMQNLSVDFLAESLDVTALNVYFLNSEGGLVDTTECEMTAELTWSMDSGVMQLNLDECDEQELFGELLVWHIDDETGVTPMANVIYSLKEQTVTFDMPVYSGMMVVQVVDAMQISYTAQYYGYTLQGHEYNANNPVEGDVKGLPVINTANGGNNTGGTLPVNNITPVTFEMPLKNVGTADSPIYMLNSTDTLTRLYKDAVQTYAEAPNVFYLDKLAESTGYSLSEIWLNTGGDVDSTDPSNWVVYSADTVHFTCRPEFAAGQDDILCIQNGSVVRMVYAPTSDDFNATATFYDYDITGNSSSTGWYNTVKQGINAEGNYSGNGAKLAFGNQNTQMGREDEQLNGYYINKANRNPAVYKLCSFGIVQGLDENGHLVYSSGVIAPNLFNEGAANGKYTYENSSLTFKRYGDNYTLYSVSVPNAGSVINLNEFTNPRGWNGNAYENYTNIFTNNFWPVDNATNRKDPNFGNHSEPKYYTSDLKKAFPFSDDDKAHNSYFGMQYSVSFQLTEDYIGPLNYLFYGDDDMWVFLTYPDGKSKLICDIGGVHSSVGQYVDLWDWVNKDNDEGSYKLTFFYTERGASGSTCYMSFTLPSVFGVNILQETSDLTVQKNVVGEADPDEEFGFFIRFYDTTGNEIKDDYLYTRYTAAGDIVHSDLVICDGATFKLKAGEYIKIRGLPYGLRYTITETAHDGYTVFNSVNGVVSTGDSACGTIMLDVVETVVFTNTVNTIHGLILQKLDTVGKALTGAEFELKNSSGFPVLFVDNDNATYTVPDSVTDYITVDKKYYLAWNANTDWIIGTDGDNNAVVLKQKSAGIAVKLTKNEDGSYSIYDAQDKNLRLNVKGDTVMFFRSGQELPTDDEKWILVANDDGSLMIKPRNAVICGSDMVLALANATASDGNTICIWKSNDSDAQKWKLIPIDPDAAETTHTLVVGDNGRLTIANLAPGSYTLTETKSPNNCQGLAQSVTFTVAKDGTVTISDNQDGKVFVDSGNAMQINVANDYVKQKLTLTKLVEIVETTQEFEFQVTWCLDGAEEDTVETLKLKHNESTQIEIPYGATVTIEELNHKGYGLRFQSDETPLENLDGKLTITMTGDMSITAINTGTYELPATGGTGTYLYTVGGLLLVIGAMYLLYIQNKHRKEEHAYS